MTWLRGAVTLVIVGLVVFAGWTLYEKGKLSEKNKVWAADYAAIADSAKYWKAQYEGKEPALRYLIDTVEVYLKRPTLVVSDTIPIEVLVQDTAWAIKYVRDSQAALKQCNQLRLDCDSFRITANSRILTLETQVKTLEDKPEKSCKMPFLVGVGSGVGLVGATIAIFKE